MIALLYARDIYNQEHLNESPPNDTIRDNKDDKTILSVNSVMQRAWRMLQYTPWFVSLVRTAELRSQTNVFEVHTQMKGADEMCQWITRFLVDSTSVNIILQQYDNRLQPATLCDRYIQLVTTYVRACERTLPHILPAFWTHTTILHGTRVSTLGSLVIRFEPEKDHSLSHVLSQQLFDVHAYPSVLFVRCRVQYAQADVRIFFPVYAKSNKLGIVAQYTIAVCASGDSIEHDKSFQIASDLLSPVATLRRSEREHMLILQLSPPPPSLDTERV